MRKYSTFISIITLILGFTFYGEHVPITVFQTRYIIAAEVVFFIIWAIIMLILLIINLKKIFFRK